MRKFGLIGDPIDHSQSPALFSEAYRGEFSYDLIKGSDFLASWNRFLNDYDGINITSPFKEQAFLKADILGQGCPETRSANIAVKTESGIKVYNSDYLAVKNILARLPENDIFVVGFGGAGKAAAAAARALGRNTIIFNRTLRQDDILPLSALDSMKDREGILIYTLPISINYTPGKGQIVVEANYKAPCLKQRAENLYISGEEWLREQARTGYKFLTGKTPAL